MARYIDADELSRRMYHDAFETDSDMQRWDSGCWIRYKMFENAINDAPTADVVERKRGKWSDKEIIEDRKDSKIQEWQQARCSVCNKWHTTPYMYYFDNYNYCPNCGADMRKEAQK